ncbi:glucose-1-phosphate adenylyltransferase family protein [Candidatus Chloroploca asiatica]|uniref:Glucose-1-phosphate adenylyltransferase n=1 Tax=Candidatus Chloroploca asiatica TaxID=1506545 RepID=A0A2H3KUP5_9CHLR|nr:sugar phosphate nucleotidyltransferase [Candidatus Chloroploca asiatica]PDV99048.1 glucose-1-phosphate adenylyltransferase [Candidatus Chloroploca asiatica]
MLRTLALILAGGDSPALSILTAERTEAAVPFAGKYRIIDFTLSNCINSGIYNVGVLTQYRPRSLHAHLGVGRPWDLDRAHGGLRVLHPSPTPDGGGWQRGTADAVRYNLDLIEDQQVDAVLLLAGDHIYKMDYRPLLELHKEREADVTMAVRGVSPHEARRYGIVAVGGDGRVDRFEEKPRRAQSNLASMGIYVFRKQFLLDLLKNSRDNDFGRHILPNIVTRCNAYAYHFQGYWADVGTLQAFYEANMALLAESPALDLYDPEWVIHTASTYRPGVELGATAQVENALLSDGARVYGTVVRSVLSPGVYVAPGAIVRDSVIMGDAWIGEGAVVDRCIIDEEVRISKGTVVGEGNATTPNQQAPERLNTGLTLIGTHTHVPEGLTIGRNVAISPRLTAQAFPKNGTVPSGATL